MNEFTINSFEDYLRIVRDEIGVTDQDGKRISASALWSDGPLVVSFYRGVW